ncbi:type III secretion system translocon subunit SctE [Yoonia sp. BS5-3]|uniref:Type III secretion system translocon subunit SctE n=1 Tax=Yoonia phaeophyticola TaxID=3137369 RepID=A0ABZ2V4Z8_9RHOB
MSDISIAGASPVQKITTEPGATDLGPSGIGLGSVAQNGAVPDAVGQSYQAITMSLSKFFLTTSGDKVDIKVAEATLKLKEVVGKTETGELVTMEEKKRQNAAEQREAAEESQKSIEEAKEAREKSKKSGLFGKIFGGIAAALSIIAGAILIATGPFTFGATAVLGAALIVGGVTSSMMLIDQKVAEEKGTGIFGTIATKVMEARGFSDEAIEKNAAKWDKAFTGIAISIMIISAVATMGAGFAASGASLGAASATAASAGSTAGGAAGAGSTVAVTAASNSVSWTARFQQISSVIGSVIMVGQSTANMSSAVFGYQAAEDQSNAQKRQADNLRLQAFNELLNDFIDQILARVSGTQKQFNAMLDEVVTSIKDRGDTLARAKFSG